jgi:hypothetical protein
MNSRGGGTTRGSVPPRVADLREISCVGVGANKIFSSGRFRCTTNTTGRDIVFLPVFSTGVSSRQRFSALQHITVRPPNFPLRNKNGPGYYTLRTVIRYDDEKSSRHACPEALAVGIVGIELDRHAPLQTRSLTRDALGSFVRSFDSMCFVGSLCASFGYTLTTGRSALTDAKAWLGARR